MCASMRGTSREQKSLADLTIISLTRDRPNSMAHSFLFWDYVKRSFSLSELSQNTSHHNKNQLQTSSNCGFRAKAIFHKQTLMDLQKVREIPYASFRRKSLDRLGTLRVSKGLSNGG